MKKFITTAAAVGAALSASAATISFSDTYGPSATDFTDTVVLPKFDSTLGTLAKVTYDIEATVTGVITADSENPQPSIVTMSISAIVDLVDPSNVVLLSLSPSTSSGPIPLGADSDGFPDFVGSDSVTFPDVTTVSTSGFTTNPVDLAGWIAAFLGETVSLDVNALGTSSAVGSGNLSTIFSQIVDGKVTVTYDYDTTVVPEASTYLSMLGLLGVAGIAGRRLVRR